MPGGRRPSARDPAPQVKSKTTKSPRHSRRGSTEAESTRPRLHERAKSSTVDTRTTEPASVVYKTHEYRDSTTSIRDDPFFRSYQSPQSIRLAKELKISQLPDESKHTLDKKGGRERSSARGSPAPEEVRTSPRLRPSTHFCFILSYCIQYTAQQSAYRSLGRRDDA